MSKADILSELHQRQLRLGTAEEQPGDYVRICDLAHVLKNLLTAEWLSRELAASGTRGLAQPPLR